MSDQEKTHPEPNNREPEFRGARGYEELNKEGTPTHEELLNDPNVVSISLRRHGAYERGDNNPVQRGQLTSETFGGVNDAASEWVAEIPEGAEVSIIASPTFMPAKRPISEEARERHPEASEDIEPRRASVTSALYAKALRQRFGEDFGGYLSPDDLTEKRKEVKHEVGYEASANSRKLDQRLGDIFEFTTAEEAENIPVFFRKLNESYGGLTPDFWRDFIRGELPDDLNEAYLRGGGDSAVEKASLALETIQEFSDQSNDEKKRIGLLVSHEEVIGSLAYQLQSYAEANQLLDGDAINELDQNRIGYNQGLDLHIGRGGKTTVELAGHTFTADLADFKRWVESKAGNAD